MRSREAAKEMGIGYNAFRTLVREGVLPVVRIPGLQFELIDPRDIEAFIAARKVGPANGPNEIEKSAEPQQRRPRTVRATEGAIVYDLDWRQRVRRK